MQDQIAGSVVGVIEPKLCQSEIERASRKPTKASTPPHTPPEIVAIWVEGLRKAGLPEA